MDTKTINRRVNVMLPEETLRLIRRVSPRGNRSLLITQAVRFYVEKQGLVALKKKIIEGAIRRSERDRTLAEEWFQLDNDSWPK